MLHNSDYQQRFYQQIKINADHGEDEIVPEDEDWNSSSESDMANYTKFQIFTIVNSIFASTKISVFDAFR